jgi:hypothetical protein
MNRATPRPVHKHAVPLFPRISTYPVRTRGLVPLGIVSGPAARMTDELVAVTVSALQAASSELYRQLA